MYSPLFVCPFTGEELEFDGDKYISKSKRVFKIKKGIPRFCIENNYSESFGFQWNSFQKIQLDSYSNANLSYERFWSETNWKKEEVKNQKVLEVGSGAGRFTEVFLNSTDGCLHSLDYSNAVEANLRNNKKYGDRLILSQASIYQMPYKDDSFDRIFCIGVLQHTPIFSKSISALVSKLKIGGEVVVDFYPSKGLITKINAKYILRPITKRLPKKILLLLIKQTIDVSLFLFDLLISLKLGILVRFLPITDIKGFPKTLSKIKRREWAIMDTFDAYSPEFDNPQKLKNVIEMFKNEGCEVTFAGIVNYTGGFSPVVRAIKNK